MKFRTEVHFENSVRKIGPESRIFSIGSCFATEMTDFLARGQMQTLSNPFGTIFNPISIKTAVKRLHDSHFYTEDDLIKFEEQFLSLDHHSSFNDHYAHKTLSKINAKIEEGNLFLQTTDFVIITLGTSFIYDFLPKDRPVANCHKIPGKFFEKRMLSAEEIILSIHEIIANFKDICREDVQLIFTVSPVRHTRDGMVENMLSKAKLIAGLHDALHGSTHCTYLPVYEILMDDLRDYRFYRDDLIHPNSQAVNYIFEKFGSAWFSEETMDFVEENLRISQAKEHRPANPESARHKEFLQDINIRVAVQQQKVKHRIFP